MDGVTSSTRDNGSVAHRRSTSNRSACLNLLQSDIAARANPRAIDLRLLLREGGPNLLDRPDAELFARAASTAVRRRAGRQLTASAHLADIRTPWTMPRHPCGGR